MKKNIIKVGFCVAYDWELLKKSVPIIYELADIIVFSIDKQRKSWAGTPYYFDETAFQSFLLDIDKDKKIQVYEDDFSMPNLSSIENDNRQRNLMAKQMGEGGWHIQIDSDEYFLDFKGFIEYLKKFNANPNFAQKGINISCGLIPLIKKTESGYIYVDYQGKPIETCPFATNKPFYSAARRNGYFNHISPFFVLHETWARGEEELLKKISSWGHDNDFIDKESFFRLWQALDAYNCGFIKNFHPLQGEVWPALSYKEGKTIEEFLQNFPVPKFPSSKSQLFLNNNRNFARLKALWSKIF